MKRLTGTATQTKTSNGVEIESQMVSSWKESDSRQHAKIQVIDIPHGPCTLWEPMNVQRKGEKGMTSKPQSLWQMEAAAICKTENICFL
jgi:hypothetical protein